MFIMIIPKPGKMVFILKQDPGISAYREMWNAHSDGLMQDCGNSIANTLELLQSCTKASIFTGPKTGYHFTLISQLLKVAALLSIKVCFQLVTHEFLKGGPFKFLDSLPDSIIRTL